MAKCRHKSQFKVAKQKHMSMRENPGSGYVVKLDDLKAAVLKALPEAKQAQIFQGGRRRHRAFRCPD